jgi:hypothetical protein
VHGKASEAGPVAPVQVASHGAGVLAEFGSVAKYCQQHSRAPVLVLPPHIGRLEFERPGGLPAVLAPGFWGLGFGRVLAPVNSAPMVRISESPVGVLRVGLQCDSRRVLFWRSEAV